MPPNSNTYEPSGELVRKPILAIFLLSAAIASFLILISHIGLSIVALPFIMLTLWCGLLNRFPFHRRIARWTFPIWLYVSITGVVDYILLKRFTA
jgi:uncharacterized membrane protein YozB (DUF420 family)